jgi:hypothetical protein
VAVLEAGLTDDFDALRSGALSASSLTANKYNGWTPIGAALRDSAHYLHANARENVHKVIVLMSDGHANKPAGNGPGYARDMAQYAAALGIRVYTISLGNGADQGLMEDIATATGGLHFDAAGSGQAQLISKLTSVFKNVAGTIKRTQLLQEVPTHVISPEETTRVDEDDTSLVPAPSGNGSGGSGRGFAFDCLSAPRLPGTGPGHHGAKLGSIGRPGRLSVVQRPREDASGCYVHD